MKGDNLIQCFDYVTGEKKTANQNQMNKQNKPEIN